MPMKGAVKTLWRLGICNHRAEGKPEMLMACKVLKISLEDLEVKQVDDFLNNLHDEFYKKGGEAEVRKHDLN